MEAIALMADIHANLPAAEAVIADIRRKHKPDRIVSLGDQVNLGPAPRDTLRLLRVEADQENILVSVAVEIGQLHRLLIRAGHRRRIGSALAAQNRIDCKLQPVIFIRMPRQRIQLVDRFDKTA